MMAKDESKRTEIEALRNECMEFCQQHSLYQEGTFPVFGEGSLNAHIVFIGEAPGYHESMSGKPFCGAAGHVLDDLLGSVGLKREEIYITNIVKVRPPNNRNPSPGEIKEFAPFLDRQLEIIHPGIICTLGNYSTRYIFEKYGLSHMIQGISRIHGKTFDVQSLFGNTVIIPLYHPAVATYNANMIGTLKEDFKQIKKHDEAQ